MNAVKIPMDRDERSPWSRMAVVWNIPTACNRATADFMISSPLMDGEYDRLVPDYEQYLSRRLASGATAESSDGDRATRSNSQAG